MGRSTIIYFSLIFLGMRSAQADTLQQFIVNYFQQSQEAFALIGQPAENHCELNPSTATNVSEPPAYILHLPNQGPHLWRTCSFEELTMDCRAFQTPDPAIIYSDPLSVIGALPTGVLSPVFARSTNGTSLEQIVERLKQKDQNLQALPPSRLHVLAKLFFDEEKNILGEAQRRKKVQVLSQDPRCDLNPFFLGVEQDHQTLQVCPALSVLPNALVASLFAQQIFTEASPTQQQQALAPLRPFPPNVKEALAFQKWRLIQNLKAEGVRYLHTPELRLLTVYPEALFACAYQQRPSNQEDFLRWKTETNVLAQLAFTHEALLCPVNKGEHVKP
ncbi:MAG: hypothetical protein A2X86_15220 [Bdellovibrionales bacterium GWA2_49_15]|nr:MAG: hypothetical protein A2X86_15220 [Bdellovibrionales bacterium GWA2_49_15]HAZ13304.1 hypothetical protein [Bdellovibrionales bacterium]